MQGPRCPGLQLAHPGSFKVPIKVAVETDRLELIESSTPPPWTAREARGVRDKYGGVNLSFGC